jgi:trehalose synthase
MASDDPEGILIYEKVSEKAKEFIESGDVILITADNDLLVNVLQRISNVVIQKSIREGFGLTVTEAMWKKTAVVASDVGGISDQIQNGLNGFLLKPNDNVGFAECIIELLRKPELAKKIGNAAHNSVKEKYLMIRLLDDYITLLNKSLYKQII